MVCKCKWVPLKTSNYSLIEDNSKKANLCSRLATCACCILSLFHCLLNVLSVTILLSITKFVNNSLSGSLFPLLSRILEKMFLKHFNDHSLLASQQSAKCPSHITETAVQSYTFHLARSWSWRSVCFDSAWCQSSFDHTIVAISSVATSLCSGTILCLSGRYVISQTQFLSAMLYLIHLFFLLKGSVSSTSPTHRVYLITLFPSWHSYHFFQSFTDDTQLCTLWHNFDINNYQ